MKRAGLQSLLPALSFFLVALGLAAWMWVATGNQATSVRQQKDSLELQHAAARSKLAQSDAEKNLILAHLATYKDLQQREVTEGGNRLAWLEAVQEANRAAKLYGLQYTLDPATAVSESTDLEKTRMKVRMPLLTESDLSVFLTALAARNTGLYHPHSCTLTRTGNLQPAPINQPGLEAECELYWYNIRKTGAR